MRWQKKMTYYSYLISEVFKNEIICLHTFLLLLMPWIFIPNFDTRARVVGSFSSLGRKPYICKCCFILKLHLVANSNVLKYNYVWLQQEKICLFRLRWITANANNREINSDAKNEARSNNKRQRTFSTMWPSMRWLHHLVCMYKRRKGIAHKFSIV